MFIYVCDFKCINKLSIVLNSDYRRKKKQAFTKAVEKGLWHLWLGEDYNKYWCLPIYNCDDPLLCYCNFYDNFV